MPKSYKLGFAVGREADIQMESLCQNCQGKRARVSQTKANKYKQTYN